MNRLLKSALDTGLAANQLVTSAASNGFDRMFRTDSLVRSALTPSTIIHTRQPMVVRHYKPLEESLIPLNDGSDMEVRAKQRPVPIVIVPPLAATSLVFDLMPERSLVRYLLAHGYAVYMIDWQQPGKQFTHLGVKDFAEDLMGEGLAAVREHAGAADISLLGWCMGGLFSLIYSGLSHDDHIRNIVTIAAPIDSRQGGVAGQLMAMLDTPVKLVRKYTNFRIHNVDPKYLNVPGWMNALAFKLTNPVGSLTTYVDLLTRLWDREFVEAHTTTSNFLDNMFDYPGGIVQDFFIKLGVDNDLSRGRIEIGDKVSNFDHIDASVLVIAGEADAIVTPKAAHKIIDLVASNDKEFVVAPGGHAGVLMGGKAQRAVWAVVADWLETRSS
ncbi:alpha/beta fold hydrolase [bacterium]|nr:alpha/beta fold hydrolase [bacterium]